VDTLFISTAIPFVNGAPHLGHALEFVQADVLARHARARGSGVFLLTGTDEHAVKNVRAAAVAGRPIDEFVGANAARFRSLADALGRRPVVEALWRRAAAAGDLYRSEYEAWYCGGCEEFREPPCPEHDAPCERVVEENWFFRLSCCRSVWRFRTRSSCTTTSPPTDARSGSRWETREIRTR